MTDAGAAAEVQRGGEPQHATVKREADRLTPLVVLLAFVVLVWVGYWVVVSRVYTAEQSRGLFGDMFGGINALFSAGAFAGLIYTVLLQRKELRLQREELAQTREELRGQKVQLELQNAVLRRQSFENTFFEMIRLHQQIVDALEIPLDLGGSIRSRRAFLTLYREFANIYRDVQEGTILSTPLEHIQAAYQKLYASRQSQMGHYFRNMYHIVKFVAEEIPEESQSRYTSIIRAQLSTYEHLMLFYNGLSPYGTQKFKPLIERFALLENMPVLELIYPRHHQPLYNEEAYGDMLTEEVAATLAGAEGFLAEARKE